MRFNDITASIQQAWAFILLPLLQVLAAYLVCAFLNPLGTKVLLARASTLLYLIGSDIEAQKATLALFGLTALIPTLSVVAFLGLLFLLRGPILSFVSGLPPSLGVLPDAFMLQKKSVASCLLILRSFSVANSFNEAYYLALGAAPLPSADETYWSTKLTTWSELQALIKFTLIIGICACAIDIVSGSSPLTQLLRFAVVFVLLFIAWVAVILANLYVYEQAFYADEQRILRYVKDTGVDSEGAPKSSELFQLDSARKQRWWYIDFSQYRLRWIRDTLFPPATGTNR